MISIPQNHTSLRFSCYICHALRTIFLTSDITQGDKGGAQQWLRRMPAEWP